MGNFGDPASHGALLHPSKMFYYEGCGIAHKTEDKTPV